jgi:hypothetical protein
VSARTIAEAAAAAEARGVALYHDGSDWWVCRLEDGSMWTWPAQDNGWSRRREWAGDLTAVAKVPLYNAAGTGWPPLTTSAAS